MKRIHSKAGPHNAGPDHSEPNLTGQLKTTPAITRYTSDLNTGHDNVGPDNSEEDQTASTQLCTTHCNTEPHDVGQDHSEEDQTASSQLCTHCKAGPHNVRPDSSEASSAITWYITRICFFKADDHQVTQRL